MLDLTHFLLLVEISHAVDSLFGVGGSHTVPGEGVVAECVCCVIAEFQECVGVVHEVELDCLVVDFYWLDGDCYD